MRNSWLVLTLSVVSLVPEALAQPCAPIRFNVLPLRTIASSSSPVTGSGVLRQADGSFTLHAYRRTSPGLALSSFVKGEVLPNLQSELFECSGQTLGPLAPAPIATPFAPLPGATSTEVLVTNLTGDNRPAMVVFDSFSAPDSVVVGIFDETATLQSTTSYATGRNPAYALAADFNGDGRTDLGVLFQGDFGSADGGVSILMNAGDGTLEEAVNYITGEFPSSAVAANLNGDSFLDLAVTHSNQQQIKVLFGQAGGAFGAPVTIATAGFPGAIAAARINGDAFDDLVFGAGTSASLLLSNGAGGFSASIPIDSGVNPSAIAAGDLNHDGRVDLAFGSTAAGLVAAVLGDGAGGFGPPVRHPGGSAPGAVFISDFDRDGAADIVSATGHPDALTWLPFGSEIAVLRGKGDGTFFGAETIFGRSANATVAADFNRDGAPDLAISRQGGVDVALGRGDGTFQDPSSVSIAHISGVGGPQQLAAGDLNNDDIPDLLVVTDNGSTGLNNVWSLIGSGNGTFQAPVSTATVWEPGAVLTGDLNNDGRDDVVVLGSNGFRDEHGFAVHMAGAGGALGAMKKTLFDNTVRPVAMALGRANGDMALDLFVVNNGSFGSSDGGVLVLMGDGAGGFGAPTTLAAGQNPKSITAADANGDAILDLLVSAGVPDTFDNQLLTFLGNGDGSFRAPESAPVEFGPGEILFDDFSGDGVKDIVLMHCCGDVSPSYLLGAGGGIYEPEVLFYGGGEPSDPVAADFNKDGLMDLAIASNPAGGSGGVAVLLNVAGSGPTLTPTVNAAVNAASGLDGSLSSGELISIYGENLGPAEGLNGFAMGLGGTRVFANGIECVIGYTSALQVNAILTMQLASSGPVNIEVEYGGVRSAPRTLNLAPSSPGIFTQEFGLGQAWVVNQDGSFNSAGNPAARGEYITFFATGQGVTNPVLVDGDPPLGPAYPIPVLELSVTIGGQPIPAENISFKGLVYAGVIQVNLVVSPNIPIGTADELIITIGGVASRPGVKIAIE